MSFKKYLDEINQTIQEGFEADFMKALGNVKAQTAPETGDLEDEGVSARLAKDLETFVKSLNKIKGTFTEKDFHKMSSKLFEKSESKRILNHFLRKKIFTGEYESATKVQFTMVRKIDKKDYMNFY